MKSLYGLLVLISVGLLALWLGERVLASGCLLALGVYSVWRQRPAEVTGPPWEDDSEDQRRDDGIPYTSLILAAMEWATCGKTAWVSQDEDPQHPHVLYVGYHVPSGLGAGQTFLPELEITARGSRPVYAVGAAASREV